MSCKCYHADRNFLGKIGVCWGTKEREACSCGGNEAKCDFYDYVRERVKKPTTNADRIRAMTDEELAEFLEAIAPAKGWSWLLQNGTWRDWLKKENEAYYEQQIEKYLEGLNER